MERISVNDLDPDCFHSEFWTCEEEPFTGIVVDKKGGRVRGEWFRRGGWRWGPQREWCKNGGLGEAYYCIAGRFHGFRREWESDGRKFCITEYRFGVEIRSRKWDFDGSIRTESDLEGPNAALVENLVEEGRQRAIELGGDPSEVPVQFLELMPGEWDDPPTPGDAARWAALDR